MEKVGDVDLAPALQGRFGRPLEGVTAPSVEVCSARQVEEQEPTLPYVPLNAGDGEGGAGIYAVPEADVRPPASEVSRPRGVVCWGGRPGGHGPA